MSCEAKHICLNSSCHFQAVLDGSGGNRPGQVGTIWKTHFQVQAKRYTSLLWYWLLKPLCRGFGVQLDYKHNKTWSMEWSRCAKLPRVICSNYFKHQPRICPPRVKTLHTQQPIKVIGSSGMFFVDAISSACFWFLLYSAAGQIHIWNIVVCKT